jgi:hypothetical protein
MVPNRARLSRDPLYTSFLNTAYMSTTVHLICQMGLDVHRTPFCPEQEFYNGKFHTIPELFQKHIFNSEINIGKLLINWLQHIQLISSFPKLYYYSEISYLNCIITKQLLSSRFSVNEKFPETWKAASKVILKICKIENLSKIFSH